MSSADRKPDRILVAVSQSPYSGRLIEAAHKIAQALSAPWIALNVDTGTHLVAVDRLQLDQNVELARALGAEIMTLADFDLAHAILDVARTKGVTQVIVGRPEKKRFQEFLRGGSFLDRLVRDAKDIDVHVIRENMAVRTSGKLPRRRSPLWDRAMPVWNTLWFLLALSAANRALLPLIQYRAVGFLFLLGVFAVGIFGGMGPVLFAAGFSALVWDFFFIPPRHALTVSSPEDILMLVAYFASATIIGLLANRSRRQQIVIRERESRTAVLYEIVSALATVSDKTRMLSRVSASIGSYMKGSCKIILARSIEDLEHVPTKSERALAEQAFQTAVPVGWMTARHSDATCLFIPLQGPSEKVGVLQFSPSEKRRISRDDLGLLYTACTQLSIALERELLADRAQESERLIESEKLHQTLLNSISHELRTPLTAIIGCATALDEKGVLENEQRRTELIRELTLASNRLNRVVENLLDMTRLNAGVLTLKREWHVVDDLIGISIGKIRSFLKDHPLDVRVDPNLPLLSLDLRLMEHVLSNILLNAATYSPEGSLIEIGAAAHEGNVRLTIRDHGRGIPEQDLERIFEKFYRVPGSPPGGTGLGLSIAQSIVELHGGRIKAESASGGGTRFIISLPAVVSPATPQELEMS